MTRLRLVRHGQAIRHLAEDDPGLGLEGIDQATRLADSLRTDPPQHLKVSPCRRARETALPLSHAFGLEREIVPAYDEFPWTAGQTVVDRETELKGFLAEVWGAAPPKADRWRERLVAAALGEQGDVVIVTHMLAINALVGAATADARTLIFRPDNASVTEIALTADGLSLVTLGRAAA